MVVAATAQRASASTPTWSATRSERAGGSVQHPAGDRYDDRAARPGTQWLWLARAPRRPAQHAREPDGRRCARPARTGTRPQVTVLVDDELSFEPVDGIQLLPEPTAVRPDARPAPGPARCAGSSRPSCCTPATRLAPGCERGTGGRGPTAADDARPAGRHWVEQLHPLRRARMFRQTDRRHRRRGALRRRARREPHVPPLRTCPSRIVSDRDSTGQGRRRWTDAEWDLPDGTTLVLEVDGAFHTEVRQWGDDLKRAAPAHRPGAGSSCAARRTRCVTRLQEVATDLIALGIRGRVPDDAA